MKENPKFKIGQSKVNVFKTEENGKTNRIHQGIVVGITSSFLRVFNPDKTNQNGDGKGGDGSPHNAQWFSINSAVIKCIPAGELKEPIYLPADL